MHKSLLYIIALCFLFHSCGSDDSCTSEMVVGTYVGTSECDDPSSEGPTSIIVSLSGENLILTDQDGFEYEVSFDGCDNDIPRTSINIFGIDISYSGEVKFSGENIELIIDVQAGGLGDANCTFVGTRRM